MEQTNAQTTEQAEKISDAVEDAPQHAGKKQAWITPAIRASAHFDKQALACSMADMTIICNGGSSSS